MKIRFRTEGGFAALPGLSGAVEIDTEMLAAEDRVGLEQAVRAARFFERPIGPPRGAFRGRDQRTYEITIEPAPREPPRTLRVTDPAPPELRRLVEWLRVLSRSRTSTRDGRAHE